MGSLEVVFAVVVTVLAALAVIGALVFAVVWEVCAIRRTLAEHHARMNPPARLDPSTRYWPEHSAVTIVDGITDDERDRVRQMAGRVLAGDRLRDIAKEPAP